MRDRRNLQLQLAGKSSELTSKYLGVAGPHRGGELKDLGFRYPETNLWVFFFFEIGMPGQLFNIILMKLLVTSAFFTIHHLTVRTILTPSITLDLLNIDPR